MLNTFCSNEFHSNHPRLTLGDYRRLDNLDEISLGFQPANLVVFDIKNSVLVNLKSNQFAARDLEDCNTYLAWSSDARNDLNLGPADKEVFGQVFVIARF